jgi:hypothetical protein
MLMILASNIYGISVMAQPAAGLLLSQDAAGAAGRPTRPGR